MSIPVPALPLSSSAAAPVKKKRVLLIDTSHATRDLRAEVLRKLGMVVDCAEDIAEARSWWRAALYDLVLISMKKGQGHRDKFCNDVRSATPPQRVAFLVGQPDYIADSPNADDKMPVENNEKPVVGELKVASFRDGGEATQRWGILEASRRISAVRSASAAHMQALRALPPAPRDSEARPLKKPVTMPSLDDLLREEVE
jgi:CheY-like chemotaxis protein